MCAETGLSNTLHYDTSAFAFETTISSFALFSAVNECERY